METPGTAEAWSHTHDVVAFGPFLPVAGRQARPGRRRCPRPQPGLAARRGGGGGRQDRLDARPDRQQLRAAEREVAGRRARGHLPVLRLAAGRLPRRLHLRPAHHRPAHAGAPGLRGLGRGGQRQLRGGGRQRDLRRAGRPRVAVSQLVRAQLRVGRHRRLHAGSLGRPLQPVQRRDRRQPDGGQRAQAVRGRLQLPGPDARDRARARLAASRRLQRRRLDHHLRQQRGLLPGQPPVLDHVVLRRHIDGRQLRPAWRDGVLLQRDAPARRRGRHPGDLRRQHDHAGGRHGLRLPQQRGRPGGLRLHRQRRARRVHLGRGRRRHHRPVGLVLRRQPRPARGRVQRRHGHGRQPVHRLRRHHRERRRHDRGRHHHRQRRGQPAEGRRGRRHAGGLRRGRHAGRRRRDRHGRLRRRGLQLRLVVERRGRDVDGGRRPHRPRRRHGQAGLHGEAAIHRPVGGAGRARGRRPGVRGGRAAAGRGGGSGRQQVRIRRGLGLHGGRQDPDAGLRRPRGPGDRRGLGGGAVLPVLHGRDAQQGGAGLPAERRVGQREQPPTQGTTSASGSRTSTSTSP